MSFDSAVTASRDMLESLLLTLRISTTLGVSSGKSSLNPVLTSSRRTSRPAGKAVSNASNRIKYGRAT